MLLIATLPLAIAEDAPSMYFEPADGTGTCGEVTQIDLMVNTSTDSGSANAWVYFDPTCVNITNVDYTGCVWQPNELPGWANFGNYVTVVSTNTTSQPPGVYKVATLDVECIGDVNCISDITLTSVIPAGSTVHDTTLTCIESSVLPVTLSIGDCTGSITMPIQFTDATDVGAVDITLTYDPLIVQVDTFVAGDMDYTEANMEVPGTARIGGCQSDAPGLDGSFDLASFSFSPVATVGSSALTLTITTLKDATPTGNEVAYIVMNGVYMTLLNGDVNDDDVVNVADGVYIMKYVIGVPGTDTINEDAADVNGDGILDMHDATYLFKHLAGVNGFKDLR